MLNVKIDIVGNLIYKNKESGITVRNLALCSLNMVSNEILKNEGDNLRINNVHHKANEKFGVRVENCLMEGSKSGYGFIL